MNRQEFYRQEYRRLKPEWQDSQTILHDQLAHYITPDSHVLDIGCGHTDFFAEVYAKTPHTYGIDPDAHTLEKNKTLAHKTIGRAEELPYDNNFFDAVILLWVLEHLENPRKVFTEVYRVLKPGGKVFFLTPNTFNYNTWLIRAVPNRFHHFFTKRLYDRQDKDTFPVRYRINSERQIDKTLLPIGFHKKEMIFNGDPSYISFNMPLFRIACLLEKAIDGISKSARVHLIGVYGK